MALFLTVYTQYGSIQLGLFKNTQLIHQVALESTKASAYLLIAIQDLLNQCQKPLDFIAAHQGPAPFTTLRVALATVNGIAFATQLPLVPIDGLQVFLNEYSSEYRHKAVSLSSTQCSTTPITPVILLNAFAHEIYYAYYSPENQYIRGVSTTTALLEQLVLLPGDFYFIGNAVEPNKHLIQHALHKRAHIPEPVPQQASLQAIAQQALTHWQAHYTTHEIQPLYLKSSSSNLG